MPAALVHIATCLFCSTVTLLSIMFSIFWLPASNPYSIIQQPISLYALSISSSTVSTLMPKIRKIISNFLFLYSSIKSQFLFLFGAKHSSPKVKKPTSNFSIQYSMKSKTYFIECDLIPLFALKQKLHIPIQPLFVGIVIILFFLFASYILLSTFVVNPWINPTPSGRYLPISTRSNAGYGKLSKSFIVSLLLVYSCEAPVLKAMPTTLFKSPPFSRQFISSTMVISPSPRTTISIAVFFNIGSTALDNPPPRICFLSGKERLISLLNSFIYLYEVATIPLKPIYLGLICLILSITS